nr:radical SAM protein [Desulfobacterales bacterium]
MGSCRHCGRTGRDVSSTVAFCADCIREHFDQVWPEIESVHRQSRSLYGLPLTPPYEDKGITCGICFHHCQIPDGKTGFCGLRYHENGKIKGGRPHEGNLSYYFDPLPTNCVASFVCPGGVGSGYPHYANLEGPEYGYKNLAVFYHACSFNCLYCQNYHFKQRTPLSVRISAKELAGVVDTNTSCICYFGGDPTPQIMHALKSARIALKRLSGRILRICWETNGAMEEPFLSMMADVTLSSGGCIKFDLKAWDEGIHKALCGVSNRKTLANFKKLSRLIPRRPEPPFLIASTLLVPGYVDKEEVAGIARFIASLDPNIPYSLLAFHPQFFMYDLPPTSRRHASRCKEAAQSEGLHRVHLGNTHLLGDDYTC